jgi:hypothetical protein
MEAICAPDNLKAAMEAVVRNKGAPGIDGITVKQLPSILSARWPEIKDQLLQGRYQPQPVRRVKIPKPAGGTRNLGIPTVIDRGRGPRDARYPRGIGCRSAGRQPSTESRYTARRRHRSNQR